MQVDVKTICFVDFFAIHRKYYNKESLKALREKNYGREKSIRFYLTSLLI